MPIGYCENCGLMIKSDEDEWMTHPMVDGVFCSSSCLAEHSRKAGVASEYRKRLKLIRGGKWNHAQP